MWAALEMLGMYIISGVILLVTVDDNNNVNALKTLGGCGRHCGRAKEPQEEEDSFRESELSYGIFMPMQQS